MVEIVNQLYAADNKLVMLQMPNACIDLVIFSPPYYKQRNYGRGSDQIGQEKTPEEFVNNLSNICDIIKNVLKSTGSMYIVIGDKYENKNLLGTPWRLAIELQKRKWILRNDIIWYKPNVTPTSARDRLKVTYEHVFHFVKNKKYYYNLDMIRVPHLWATRDKRSLQRRVEHKSGKSIRADSEYSMSGVGYHPLGKNPGDFFSINTGGYKGAHFAVFPPQLLVKPIVSSCPPDGLVMDPFVGSGTVPYTCELINKKKWKELKHIPNKTVKSTNWNLKWLGIDIKEEYIKLSEERMSKAY